MTKLNDTMRILLASAAQRKDMSLLPPPGTMKPGDRVNKALAGLVTVGFAVERDTVEPSSVHRTDGDLRLGLFATESGLAAIGITNEAESASDGSAAAPPPAAATAGGAELPAKTTKKSQVLELLRRDGGASLPELVAATGWLPHTMRAALTGLRKGGHVVDRFKRGSETCYRIGAEA